MAECCVFAGRAAPVGTDLQPLLDLTGRAKGADVVALGFQVRRANSGEVDRAVHPCMGYC